MTMPPLITDSELHNWSITGVSFYHFALTIGHHTYNNETILHSQAPKALL